MLKRLQAYTLITMINIKKLSKSYGDDKVVDNLNLEIKKGTIFGFLGPNGAGKTTTIKMLVGLSRPTSGEIKIENKNIEKSQEIIGFMPEDPYFYDHLTALEFMQYMRSLFNPARHSELVSESRNEKIPKRVRDDNKKRQEDNINSLLALVGLKKAKKQKIGQFSKGMKQRLGLAQAIINDPEYLFLDEPLDGLDPIGRREFKEILLNLKKLGKTIFFNSHILSDVEEICDQIGIIDKGKLIYSGPVKKFRGNKSLEDAFVDRLTNQPT